MIKCPACGSTKIIFLSDSGEKKCAKCGTKFKGGKENE